MATSSNFTLCTSCAVHSSTTKPKPGLVNCIGCQKMFCIQHISVHRQELATELGAIVYQRNIIQEALESLSFDTNAEFALIDTWVKETIDLIYKTADNARQKVKDLAEKYCEDLKAKCRGLTEQIETFQQSKNCFEHDLNTLRKSLDRLNVSKDKLNIEINFSNVGNALDEAIQLNLNVCTVNDNQVVSVTGKVLRSIKPFREVCIPELSAARIVVTDAGALLIDNCNGFLFVHSDGSMRNLSTLQRCIYNMRWSNHLYCLFYYIFMSRKEPNQLIAFYPANSASGVEEVVTLNTEGSIQLFDVFENSLLIVCALSNSRQTIEEWSLQGKQWHQSLKPRYRWRSPISCLCNECIEYIAFNGDSIGLIICTDGSIKSYRFELRNRKMVVQGHVPLNTESDSIWSPGSTLQRFPDGWLITIYSSFDATRFMFITNDLKLYKQSYLDNLNLTDLLLVNGNWQSTKLLVAVYRILAKETKNCQLKILFYEIE